jgi:hypothetical protein
MFETCPVKRSLLILGLLAGCLLSVSSFAEKKAAPPVKPVVIKFTYTVSVDFDFDKRLEYLKRTGEAPGVMEKALSVLKGNIYAADFMDTVELSPQSYRVYSKGDLTSVITSIIGEKKLTRESQGQRSTAGLFSTAYYEKRPDNDPFIARLDASTKKVTFFEGKQVKGSEPFEYCIDPLSIPYLFLGRPFPQKDMTVRFTDGRGIKTYTLIRGGDWTLTFQGKKTLTTRFYKKVTKDDPAVLEVYYSADNHYPIRAVLGLSDRYGAIVLFELKQVTG